ncbi:MAG: glycosyltransferase family 2 protein [Prevotellaceae bacterium]|nr:glycosyltransferase family 2 protein [Candidatus Minthosoma caballi]
MNPTYSIIIPHYKTVATLNRCLESIPLCPEAEAIVVDDASGIPHESMPMHDNPYVHYIYLDTNSGPGVARNRGVEAAKGKWIIFIDADDYFLYGAFFLLDRYKDSDFDLVLFGAEFRDNETQAKEWRNLLYHRYFGQHSW